MATRTRPVAAKKAVATRSSAKAQATTTNSLTPDTEVQDAPHVKANLTPTDVPGVFTNKAGVLVNKQGVAVSFAQVKKADDARFEEVLGRKPTKPLDILEGVALDPRAPMVARFEAAKAAAPYTSPRLVAVQGGGVGAPPLSMEVAMTVQQLRETAARVAEKV